MKNKRELFGPREINSAIERMDTKLLLNKQVRQVRWLYNNAGKCSMVYDEKLVRLLIQKLEMKVKELEEMKSVTREDAIEFALAQNFSFPRHVLEGRFDAFLNSKQKKVDEN